MDGIKKFNMNHSLKKLIGVFAIVFLVSTLDAFEMIHIPAVKFHRIIEGKKQTVSLRSIYISDTNITVGEWTDYLIKSGKSKTKINNWRGKIISSLYNNAAIEINESWPAFYISFHEVAEYCNWLSLQNGLEPVFEITCSNPVNIRIKEKANGYRVMTKAEWEYLSGFAKGEWTYEDLLEEGCFWENNWLSNDDLISPVPVKSFKKNSFGVYDIIGTISEFLCDFYNVEKWVDYIENPKGALTFIPDENQIFFKETPSDRRFIALGGFETDVALVLETPFSSELSEREGFTGFHLVRNGE